MRPRVRPHPEHHHVQSALRTPVTRSGTTGSLHSNLHRHTFDPTIPCTSPDRGSVNLQQTRRNRVLIRATSTRNHPFSTVWGQLMSPFMPYLRPAANQASSLYPSFLSSAWVRTSSTDEHLLSMLWSKATAPFRRSHGLPRCLADPASTPQCHVGAVKISRQCGMLLSVALVKTTTSF